MVSFLLALTLFLAAHLLPAAPALRTRLVAALGRPAYLALYSALSLALLAWVIVAAREAETVTLWDPAPWQWWVPFLAMPFAAFLVVGGLVEANPLSISLRAGNAVPAIAVVTRHPLLWGFLLWSLAHVPPNGRLVPVLLFVAMAVLSVAGFAILDAKARRRIGPAAWQALARQASAIPFAALIGGRAKRPRPLPLALSAAAAIALFAWFLLQGHATLIGVDPLASYQALL